MPYNSIQLFTSHAIQLHTTPYNPFHQAMNRLLRAVYSAQFVALFRHFFPSQACLQCLQLPEGFLQLITSFLQHKSPHTNSNCVVPNYVGTVAIRPSVKLSRLAQNHDLDHQQLLPTAQQLLPMVQRLLPTLNSSYRQLNNSYRRLNNSYCVAPNYVGTLAIPPSVKLSRLAQLTI